MAIYNPKSRGRATYLNQIRDIVLEFRKPETPVGIVRKAGRPGMTTTVTTLEKLPEADVDMQSTVIIGNSNTYVADGIMITPRGTRFDLDYFRHTGRKGNRRRTGGSRNGKAR